jgi:hypothetical protein
LPDGSVATMGADGLGWRTDAKGESGWPFAFAVPEESSALGDSFGPGDLEILRRMVVRRPSPSGADLLVSFRERDHAGRAHGRLQHRRGAARGGRAIDALAARGLSVSG